MKVLVCAGIAVCAALGWWLISAEDDVSIPDGANQESRDAAIVNGRRKPGDSLRKASTSRFREGDRSDAPATENDVDDPIGDGPVVRVVRESDGTPVVGATVYFGVSPENPGRQQLELLTHKTMVSAIRAISTHRFKTDAKGETRVPRSNRLSGVFVFSDVGSGRANLAVDAKDDVVVEVREPLSVNVIVRTPNGAGVPGVPVGLALNGSRLPVGAVTDPGGRARVEHLEAFGPSMPNGELEITMDIPLSVDVGVPIDLKSLPARPIVFILPKTTQLDVDVVDQAGRAVANAHVVVAAGDVLGDKSRGVHRRADATGRASFAQVGLGVRVNIMVWTDHMPDPTNTPHSIASEPGVIARARVTFGTQGRRFVARVLDSNGEPVADQELKLDGVEGEQSTITDAEGRVRIPIARGESADGQIAFLADSRIGFATWSALRAGDNDLGTIRLSSMRVAAAGQIVDDTGAPLPGARVDVSDGDEFGDEVVTDAAGRFTTYLRPSTASGHDPMGHESSEPTVMTICVSHRGFAAVSLEDIPIGKRDLHIPMQSGGRCTLKVLTPRGMGVRDLFATISGDDDGSGGAITKVEDGVFTFDWDDRAAGFHDLTLMLRKPSWMLAQIERLRIESGSDAEDPRLLVDLRSRLRRTDLILVNGRRQPIGGSLRVIADGADLQTRAVLLLEVDLPKRRSTLFIPSETVTALRFTCPGYVPRTVTLPLSDDEIVLEAGPRVRFRLTGAPVPPNHTLVAWIESSSTGIDSRRCEFESTGRTGIVGLETPGRWRMTFALRLGGEYDHLDGVVRTFDVKDSLNLQKFEVALSNEEIATGIRER